MEKSGLSLAPEKTRMLLCGRFAHERVASYGGKPGTFEFLGFKHVCGVDAKGTCALIRIPSERSCRKCLDSTYVWLPQHRHWRRRDQQRHLDRDGYRVRHPPGGAMGAETSHDTPPVPVYNAWEFFPTALQRRTAGLATR
jgi:hypothetical protein